MENTTEENVCNEALKKIHQMVKKVKEDKEVSLEYMKIWEREQMLLEQGRREERVNTEAERKRADKAEQELEKVREELKRLKSA